MPVSFEHATDTHGVVLQSATRQDLVRPKFAAHGMAAPGAVRSADQEGPSMVGTVGFSGVPNQPESASRSASEAVSVGSSMVAAQAMWTSGRIRRASAGR